MFEVEQIAIFYEADHLLAISQSDTQLSVHLYSLLKAVSQLSTRRWNCFEEVVTQMQVVMRKSSIIVLSASAALL